MLAWHAQGVDGQILLVSINNEHGTRKYLSMMPDGRGTMRDGVVFILSGQGRVVE